MKGGRLLFLEGTDFDWIITGLAIGVFVVLVILAWRRPNRQRLALRIVLTGVAVASLVFMAWQPRWQTTPRPVEAVLVTRGASPLHVAHLADSLNLAHLYALPGLSASRPAGRDVEEIPDVGFLVRNHPEVATLHVVGEGVPGYALEPSRGVVLRAHLAPPKPGVQFVDFPRWSGVGQVMRVQGRVFLDESPRERWPYTLYLDGPGGVTDSMHVAVPGPSSFSLKAVPRQEGRYRYRLALVDASGDTLSAEPFGGMVRNPESLSVLVLQGAPRFEVRHLKNWLAEEGGRMVIRTTVSRDRYRTEFLNQPERDFSRITPDVLRTVDVVLLDERTLATLAASERRDVQEAVEEGGLGLLFNADVLMVEGAAREPRFFKGFSGRLLDEAEGRRVHLAWEGETLASSIPAEPYAIDPAWGIEPLMHDEAGRSVAVMRQQGMGRVGLSLATETYRWVLEGNPAMHAAYWSYLFSMLARSSREADQWAVDAQRPVFRDTPVVLRVHTSDAAPMGLVFSTDAVPDTLYLAQDLVEPLRWRGTFWPRNVGWHRITRVGAVASTDASFWFYVVDAASWQALQAAENTRATRQFEASSASEVVERTGPLSSMPVSLWWFFIPFLASSTGLWLESKL